jgi:23S rRNA pseudoU1915 N3-methylase RlmH
MAFAAVPGDARLALLRVADEALVLQREGERLMAEISDGGPLGDLAVRGGPIISRFVALRRELPRCPAGRLASAREILDMVLANHALALHAALDLLAVSWRSERMAEELDRLEGLGRPAIWLRTIRDELAEELETPA